MKFAKLTDDEQKALRKHRKHLYKFKNIYYQTGQIPGEIHHLDFIWHINIHSSFLLELQTKYEF